MEGCNAAEAHCPTSWRLLAPQRQRSADEDLRNV
jgi:hypothetical protein